MEGSGAPVPIGVFGSWNLSRCTRPPPSASRRVAHLNETKQWNETDGRPLSLPSHRPSLHLHDIATPGAWTPPLTKGHLFPLPPRSYGLPPSCPLYPRTPRSPRGRSRWDPSRYRSIPSKISIPIEILSPSIRASHRSNCPFAAARAARAALFLRRYGAPRGRSGAIRVLETLLAWEIPASGGAAAGIARHARALGGREGNQRMVAGAQHTRGCSRVRKDEIWCFGVGEAVGISCGCQMRA